MHYKYWYANDNGRNELVVKKDVAEIYVFWWTTMLNMFKTKRNAGNISDIKNSIRIIIKEKRNRY